MKYFLFMILFLCLLSCSVQSQEKMHIDSNKYGELWYVQPDTVFFKDYIGNIMYKIEPETLTMLWPLYRLLDSNLLIPQTGAVLSYSFYNQKYDTLFSSPLISFYDRISLKDSLVTAVGYHIVMYDVVNNKKLLEVKDNFLRTNFLNENPICYLLIREIEFGRKKEQKISMNLLAFNIETLQISKIVSFDDPDLNINTFTDKKKSWEGMLLHKKLLFMQFTSKMIVFDLENKRIVKETDQLRGETTLMESTDNKVKFKTDDGLQRIIEFDCLKEVFTEIKK